MGDGSRVEWDRVCDEWQAAWQELVLDVEGRDLCCAGVVLLGGQLRAADDDVMRPVEGAMLIALRSSNLAIKLWGESDGTGDDWQAIGLMREATQAVERARVALDQVCGKMAA
jgi:hypothetical protein